ncbi:MAG: hypothetical protein ACM3PY_08620 [Omnitrophica WOR_2 bacterium]
MVTFLGFVVFLLVAGWLVYRVEESIWKANKPVPQPVRVRNEERRMRRYRR